MNWPQQLFCSILFHFIFIYIPSVYVYLFCRSLLLQLNNFSESWRRFSPHNCCLPEAVHRLFVDACCSWGTWHKMSGSVRMPVFLRTIWVRLTSARTTAAAILHFISVLPPLGSFMPSCHSRLFAPRRRHPCLGFLQAHHEAEPVIVAVPLLRLSYLGHWCLVSPCCRVSTNPICFSCFQRSSSCSFCPKTKHSEMISSCSMLLVGVKQVSFTKRGLDRKSDFILESLLLKREQCCQGWSGPDRLCSDRASSSTHSWLSFGTFNWKVTLSSHYVHYYF